jgi:mannose-1-phosphate guanylyltransferase
MRFAVILAGGKGERFWPVSREKEPKQFLAITGSKPMITEIFERIRTFFGYERIFISINQELCSSLFQIIPVLNARNVIIEPFGRNTAPAIGLAALYLKRIDPEGSMVILPADHYIPDTQIFLNYLDYAFRQAETKKMLVTFGITPSGPETGYGYIHSGKIQDQEHEFVLKKVQRFVEKPDLETAKSYLKSGEYFWNSGMFVFRIDTILDAYRVCMPDYYRALQDFENYIGTEFEAEKKTQMFLDAENISIDYAIMEKVENGAVVQGNFRWDDVGSWFALDRIREKDESGNISKGSIVAIDTKDSILINDSGIFGVLGLRNIIAVKSGNAVLICDKDRAQEVKKIIEEIKKKNDAKAYL